MALFKNVATESEACESRIVSSPLEKAGKAIMAMAPAIATTISNSMRVTPLSQPPLSALKINAFSNERIVNEGHALAVEFDKAVGM